MPALSQSQIALQMVAQLRALDPSISAEVGTPERKILDTVAQAIAEAQIDLNLLGGTLDVTSKFGTDLDNFIGMFGFGRQTGSFATGFVDFGRSSPTTYNITIPTGTMVQGGSTTTVSTVVVGTTITFVTTTAVTLAAGQTSVSAPIQALRPGSSGNVAAGAITQIANIGTPILGITTVSNSIATTNGSDSESDPELKARFQNTVFRNLAGTFDQFLALAISTQFSTTANVLGPISRYQEYLQVPATDDSAAGGGGLANQWTTAPSTNAYAKYVYLDAPNFVSTSTAGAQVFLREGVDYRLNVPPLDAGDAEREEATPTATQPNITFLNVYTGTDDTVLAARPGDIKLLEYSYISTESRNDVGRNITNCVDVYVNGENPITTDCVIAPVGPLRFSSSTTSPLYYQNFRRFGSPDTTPVAGNYYSTLFWQPVIDLPDTITVGTDSYLKDIHYYEVDDVSILGYTVRARSGIEWDNTIKGLTGTDVAVSVWPSGSPWTTGTIVFYHGVFYSANTNVSVSVTPPASDPGNWTSHATPFTGSTIVANTASSITVSGYTYDKNIVDLQSALEGSKQITTDVLAHRCITRYFKLDVTVVYSTGQTAVTVNNTIANNIGLYFSNQSFGTTVQLTDLLLTIRNTSGVKNVRWSYDDNNAEARVTECDVFGNPLSGPITFNTDFALRDSELPALPDDALSTDSVPGLIIRSRAQNTFAMP